MPPPTPSPHAHGAVDLREPRPRAVLVGVQLPGVGDAEHASHLAELARLVQTLGYDVAATVTQRRDAAAASAVLGEGKLRELAELTGGTGVVPTGAREVKNKARARAEWETPPGKRRAADDAGTTEGESDDDEGDGGDPEERTAGKAGFVIVDHEITPSQARNLERATGAEVLDRTGVIVEIFHRHARSREARLEVELARLNYVAPRMRESPGGKERQRGKGAGEAALELDRRKIRDRMAEIREQLASVMKEQENRRQARQGQLRVALVGYTNAGKSSLMRALTGSQVLVEDKLFATLDTTVRALQPETRPRILVSDTVGFIQKLPHDLVASFRSTLSEALEASLLLYVVDASDPMHRTELEVTRQVLREIGADAVPSLLLLNKADKLDADARATVLREHQGEGVLLLSAHAPADVAALRERILAFFEERMVDGELLVPYDKQSLLGEIYEHARVVGQEYTEQGVTLRVRGLPAAVAKLTRTFAVDDRP